MSYRYYIIRAIKKSRRDAAKQLPLAQVIQGMIDADTNTQTEEK